MGFLIKYERTHHNLRSASSDAGHGTINGDVASIAGLYQQHNSTMVFMTRQNHLKNRLKKYCDHLLFQKNYKKPKKNLQRRGGLAKMPPSQVVAMEIFFQLKLRRYIQYETD